MQLFLALLGWDPHDMTSTHTVAHAEQDVPCASCWRKVHAPEDCPDPAVRYLRHNAAVLAGSPKA